MDFFCRFTTILILSIGFVSGYSQESDSTLTNPPRVRKPLDIHVEIGLNGTGLLQQVLGSNGDAAMRDPYLLFTKLDFGRVALRAGVGGERTSQVQRESDFADSETVSALSTAARFGIEYQVPVGNRWTATFGIDAIGRIQEDKTILDSGFDQVTDIEREQAIGGSIISGLQVHLTPRLSLYTEAAFYYESSQTTIGRLFENFPEFDDELSERSNTRTTARLPVSIFFVYRF